MDQIVLTLPLPHPKLHPNARTRSWRWLASLRRTARGEARVVANQSKPSSCPWKRATFEAIFHQPRKRDDDGLIAWLKPCRDGIADAGIVENDSGFVTQPVEQVTGKDAGRYVEIVLTRLE